MHAHTGGDAAGASLRDVVTATLEGSGHLVDLVDLHAESFDPVMSAAEHAAYHSDAPIVSTDVRRHASLVQAADAVVFVYPAVWNGPPAVLKGWLERVLVPGVGFVFDRSGRIRPGLRNIRRIVAVATYDTPRWRVHLLGDAGRRTLARTLRMNVRRRSRPWWLAIYRATSASAEDRAAFEQHVRRRLARL